MPARTASARAVGAAVHARAQNESYCLRVLAGLVLAVLLGASSPSLARSELQPDLDRAAALLREGRAEEAWHLLAPHEFDHAGRPEFDFQLGVAALGSGRENLATFILERVLAVSPGHAAARLEIARAYFALRDYERAEREFNAVLKADPPPAIRAVVRRYLARMGRGPEARAAPLSGYAEFAVGRDSNVNVATAQDSVFMPGLGAEFVPGPVLQRQADSFSVLGAGIEVAQPLDAGRRLTAGADLRLRRHTELGKLDSQVVNVHAGLQLPHGERDIVRLALAHNEFRLDEARYRRVQSGTGQWSRTFTQRTRVSLFAQANRIRYLQEDVRESSSNLFALGLGAAHALTDAARTTMSGSIYAGADDATAGRDDGDRRLLGLNLAAQSRIAGGVEGFATVSFIHSGYRQQNAAFGTTRRDRQLDATLGLAWEIADGWFLRPQILRTVNESNLALSDYQRTEVSLSLRRVWE